MKIRQLLILAPLVLLFVVPTTYSQTQKQPGTAAPTPKIGVIKKPLADGCGCTLQLAEDYRKHNERAVFMNDFGDIIQMNIDGKDVRLKLISESPQLKKEKVGSRRQEAYSAGRDRVEIEFVTTKLCPTKDESCEATWYSATIRVIRGKQSQQIKALGICGC